MSGGLARLNALPPAEAVAAFRHCCGAARWAADMAAGRPYGDEAAVFAAAEAAWTTLGPADWLEAAGNHPRLGRDAEELAGGSASTRSWSRVEQAGVAAAAGAVRAALAEGQWAYEKRFGYIFLISAAGKSGAEIVAALELRLGNDPAVEQDVMAGELRKIVQLRVRKLIAEEE